MKDIQDLRHARLFELLNSNTEERKLDQPQAALRPARTFSPEDYEFVRKHALESLELRA